jgi:transcriptional regulator
VALKAKGYKLHEIGRVLGREEAAISRLVLRAAECGEEAAEHGAAA